MVSEAQMNTVLGYIETAKTEGAALTLGGKRVRYLDTPHVPHAWESGLMFELTTRTLFTGDLFTQLGGGPPITQEPY